uniref:C3H1-type domain-containing protein n=1 Tax=Caenorhabditis japonica TaxID=281687 RepID=A0A8R1DUW1_CAEJA
MAATNSLSSGCVTSPTKDQPQHVSYEPQVQYYYAAPMPQPVYGQPYMPQPYYPDGYMPQQVQPQYVYMAPHPQGGHGQPQPVIYYQGPPQPAPVYFVPPVPHQVPVTPLPTSREYEMMQQQNVRNRTSLPHKYQQALEDHNEIPLSEISYITMDNHGDESMSEKFARNRDFVSNNEQPANYKTRFSGSHASGAKSCEMVGRCNLRTAEPLRFPNNKYKTKLCKNFARGGTGFCPYGLRCEFVHPSDKEFENIPPYQRMMVEEQHQEEEYDYVVARHHHQNLRFHNRLTKNGAVSSPPPPPNKTLLKHRNVAGSMMCLSQIERENVNFPPHLRRNNRGFGKLQSPLKRV